MTLESAKQLYAEEQEGKTSQLKMTRQLVMLHSASCNISATLEIDQVVELIVQEFSNILAASACYLGLWNNETNQLEIVFNHHAGVKAQSESKTENILVKHPSLIEKILSRRNILHISKNTPGADKAVLKTLKKAGITSLLLLPLIVNNHPIGLIEVIKKAEHPFETYEIVIARLLANQAAIAIQNARLFQSATQEIQTRQKTEEKLKYHALHDVLTNLPNRVLFLDRLEHAISRYKRFDKLVYAVLFVDIDRFKRINDSYGHISGDQALREIAKRLAGSLREGDTVCRYGGDEFLVLLEGERGELHSEVINEITHRIQDSLTTPLLIDDHEFHMTASIGIAYCVHEVTNPTEYVRNANIAMYQAKSRGGGRAEIFTQTKELAVRSQVILESELRKAARTKSFYLKYQPIYNLDTLSVVGLEVLLRWKQNNSEIPTEIFIPLLDKLGLMPDVGLWTLQNSIQNYQSWHAYGPSMSQLTLSVNISNTQLIQEDFISRVTDLLEKTKMDPKKLILEITEHMLIEDLDLTNQKIHQLNDLGVKVYLDDFGTGYSSLSHLNSLPVQALKIDKKFVQQINPTEMGNGIVTSILSMARKFDVDVIAEGIETENQLRGLRYAECQYGQGNFLSPAIVDEKLLALLKSSPFWS